MSTDVQSTWWQRNWKWVVPTGCLFTAILICGSCASLILFVFSSMRSSWAFAEGLELARSNHEVVEELGEPIQPGWFGSGSISVSGPSGAADLSIPLRGPRGSATLHVVAHKRAGEWRFEIARVSIKGHDKPIDLLAGRTIHTVSNRLWILSPSRSEGTLNDVLPDDLFTSGDRPMPTPGDREQAMLRRAFLVSVLLSAVVGSGDGS